LPGTCCHTRSAIYARTNGYVKRWLVDIGAKVAEGQLLAEIEHAGSGRELKQAIANARQVRRTWKWIAPPPNAGRACSSARRLPAGSRRKIGAYEARKADYAAADATCNACQETKMFQRVLAPFAGTITGAATWKSAN